jgi:uncharacterized RDD family membrane protein YckC
VSDEYGPEPFPPPVPPAPPSISAPPPAPGAYQAAYPPGLPYQQAPGPPGSGMGPKPLASFGVRLGGWLIDWVLIGIVTIPFLALTHSFHTTHSVVVTNGTFVSHQTGFSIGPGGIAIQALIVIGYGAIMCGAKRGQTVGMMLVGIRAIDQQQGGAIGFARALGRAAFEYLMAILLFVPWIIDMLFPLWDPSNQTLHDKVTRTVVIKL